MKKYLPLLLGLLILGSSAFAYDVPKNEAYYKSQIQNQRYLYNETGLIGAMQDGNSETVEYYMLAGFNPNATYVSVPISFYAVKCGSLKSLESLLKHGANPNATYMKDTSLLTWSIKYKSSEAVALAIKYGADVNLRAGRNFPLNNAIASKQTKIVEILLKAGAKPDDKTAKLVSKSKDEYLKSLFE